MLAAPPSARVTRRLHPRLAPPPSRLRALLRPGRAAQLRWAMAEVSPRVSVLRPPALLPSFFSPAAPGSGLGSGCGWARRSGGGPEPSRAPALSLPFTPLPFLISPQQRQDKAALISETRRRFEADYLPGERLGGGAGDGGGRGAVGPAAWIRSLGLARCRFSPGGCL